MAKAKVKQVVIPKFSSEAKEAAWWDAHRSEIEAEIRQRVKHKRPLTLGSLLSGAKPSQPVTLRIPKEDLETARRLAAQKGLGYQTYIKMLLREALAKNAGDEHSSAIRRISAGTYREVQDLGGITDFPPAVRFRSYNPYESVYPGLRVVSRETLHLIKTLRSQGYNVVVEPNDGTKLHYLAEKGLREILSDPVYAFVLGIPTGLVLNLVANWVSQLRRSPKPDEVNLVLEFDEDGKKVRYSESGGPVRDEKVKSILSALEERRRRFEESRKLAPPDPEYFIPIHLEHTGKVVGWSKGFVPNDQERSTRLDATRICDNETWERIQRGELRGFSIAGIVSRAICLICGKEYVECDHIAGLTYDGKECTVRITILPAEISIVKDPVQPLALIERG